MSTGQVQENEFSLPRSPRPHLTAPHVFPRVVNEEIVINYDNYLLNSFNTFWFLFLKESGRRDRNNSLYVLNLNVLVYFTYGKVHF